MKSIAVIITTLASFALAAPSPDVADANARKIKITFCNKPRLGGNCHIIDDYSVRECGDVKKRVADRADSISYDDDLTCTFYTDNNCRSRDSFTPRRRGTVDDIDKDWGENRDPSSFFCDKEGGR